jgi:hypothetical protein
VAAALPRRSAAAGGREPCRESMVEISGQQPGSGSPSIYRVDGPLDLSRLKHLRRWTGPILKDKPFLPYYTQPGLGAKEDDVVQ